METIRIVKRKKAASYIWGILLALIILGALAWLVFDQRVHERVAFSSDRDTTETEDNRSFRSFGYEEGEDFSENVKAFISYVNRQILPADTIDDQMTQQAVGHLKSALDEVSDNQGIMKSGDAIVRSDTLQRQTSANDDLIETGTALVNIQENEYPALSEIGERVKETLDDLENAETSKPEDLKNFFVLSSSLIQEIEGERTDQLTTDRRAYEDVEQE